MCMYVQYYVLYVVYLYIYIYAGMRLSLAMLNYSTYSVIKYILINTYWPT